MKTTPTVGERGQVIVPKRLRYGRGTTPAPASNLPRKMDLWSRVAGRLPPGDTDALLRRKAEQLQ